jgi:Protein of unknown function (DUF5818)
MRCLTQAARRSAGCFVLRRKDGPTFADRALDKYVGKRVECDGIIVGYTLLAERIAIVPQARRH